MVVASITGFMLLHVCSLPLDSFLPLLIYSKSGSSLKRSGESNVTPTADICGSDLTLCAAEGMDKASVNDSLGRYCIYMCLCLSMVFKKYDDFT